MVIVNKTKIKQELIEVIRGFDSIRYSFLCGSFLYDSDQHGKSDIDVVAVFSVLPRLDQLKRYTTEKCRLEERYGYRSDLSYPLEVLTDIQMEEIASGALLSNIDPKKLLPSQIDDWTKENENILHLYQIVLSKGGFLYGSLTKYNEDFQNAWHTLNRILSHFDDPSKVFSDILERFKIKSKDYKLMLGITMFGDKHKNHD